MKEVFESFKIGNITLRNRIVRSATHEGLCNEKREPNEELIKKFEQLAKGGVGGIITGFVGVMENGSVGVHMPMIDSDDKIESFKKLVNRIHDCDTPIILQLGHCGRQTSSKITGHPLVAPSAIRDKLYNEDIPRELTEKEIYEVIDNFVLAIERGKKAGFDGVQLHLAHGYLLSEFLSSHMNKRKDKWGGSLENRFRIVKEILTRARAKVGDYTILVKINAYEKSKDGMNIEEAIKISKYLEDYGCDGIEVSSGIAEDGFWTLRGKDVPFDMMAKENHRIKKIPKLFRGIAKVFVVKQFKSPEPLELYNVSSVEKIKAAVNIPVIVVGGIKKLKDIEEIIKSNKSDVVAMSRPFIIESNLVNKFKEKKQLESRCIDCNFCIIGMDNRPLKCYYGKVPK
ncbi:MAG: NADH:flavin oxidoreductase [Sarcina sp.]